MDETKRTQMKAELSAIQSQIYMMMSSISMVSAAASMPIMISPTLPPVTIPGFDKVAQAMTEQTKLMEKLVKFVDDLFDQVS